MTDLTATHFKDADKAREYLEAVRWPNGPICPHCGSVKSPMLLAGKSTRAGLYKCSDCREQFTVTVGTVFERSKISLDKWLLAVHLMCASKKGVSSHQIHRMLGVTYKTAWFMTHRIREAMRRGSMAPPMGGEGKTVEIDETYIGNKKGAKKARGNAHKHAVLTLVERGGESRSFHVDGTSSRDVLPIIRANIAKETCIVTDEASVYGPLGITFKEHHTVNHGAHEYVRGIVHTNTVEGFYSVFKRGMKGVYQHCGEQHLHRYIAEFDFRYSNRVRLGIHDDERTAKAIKGSEGKRLTYRRIDQAEA